MERPRVSFRLRLKAHAHCKYLPGERCAGCVYSCTVTEAHNQLHTPVAARQQHDETPKQQHPGNLRSRGPGHTRDWLPSTHTALCCMPSCKSSLPTVEHLGQGSISSAVTVAHKFSHRTVFGAIAVFFAKVVGLNARTLLVTSLARMVARHVARQALASVTASYSTILSGVSSLEEGLPSADLRGRACAMLWRSYK
jgi:hypothetical protein